MVLTLTGISEKELQIILASLAETTKLGMQPLTIQGIDMTITPAIDAGTLYLKIKEQYEAQTKSDNKDGK